MKNYPRANRDISKRGNEKTEEDRRIAREFGKEFFDGDRKNGYGGFNYNSKYWEPVIPTFQKHFNLSSKDSILDVGCAKGFMLYDFSKLIPGIELKGIDISQYAIENCIEGMRDNLDVADARDLPFKDNSFDLVISITSIHNSKEEECIQAIREIERVSKGKSFLTVDAYRNDKEKEAMLAWNLTAKTILHVNEWKRLFKDAAYSGDYYWFTP